MIVRARRHSLVRTLAVDRFVLTFLACVAIEFVVYLVPLGSPEFRNTAGEAAFLLPFLAITTAGAAAGIRRIANPEERRFWRAVSASCAIWLVAILFDVFAPASVTESRYYLLIDLLYVCSYLPLLLAVERRPHHGTPVARRDPERLALVSSATCVTVGWFVYFVLLPAWFDEPLYGSAIPTYLLFITLDATLVALYFVVGLRCRVFRWKVLYWAVGAASLALGMTDTMDLLNEAGVVVWTNGRVTDLIWAVPPFAFLLAARLRRVPLGGGEARAAQVPRFSLEERSLSGGLVLGEALMFPLVHMWLLGILPLSPAVERAQSVLVLVVLAALGGLASFMYGILGTRHVILATARRQLEAHLRDAQRFEAVGRLAGGVAHDFNNVLTSIVGYNDMVLADLPTDDPNRPALEEIGKAATRAATLTGQLLAFSRRQILKPERISLNRIIAAVAPVLSRVIGEDIRFETRLAPDVVDVTVDPGQVQSVIYALAVNARDAMPQGGTLIVGTANVRVDPAPGEPESPALAGTAAELTVRDSGAGLPAEALLHLFEPFSPAAGRDKGLGLAAVHGIVTQSGGTISVDSVPGEGTTFRIRLPEAGTGHDAASPM